MQSINHLGFIASAYVAAIVVVVGLSAWVMIDYRLLRRRLLDLDAKGLTRRSAPKRTEPVPSQAAAPAPTPEKEQA
jgi:heme exporter protein D